jgi:glyoxylase-like metal-dependent hydrolase (beta-lactamase superfamily II)
MRLGEFELFVVSDGTFALDGGGMFGTIPKVLWEKTHPADERNRIRLGLNCLLIRTATETIVVDTGLGSFYDEKFAYLYKVDNSTSDLLGSLAKVGVAADEVTKVILTHLHFDHCGGSCTRDQEGSSKPTFPLATYHVDQEELAYAREPDRRSRASYLRDLWEPLEAHGQLALTSGEVEVSPGVSLLATPGHTQNHRSVLIRSGDETACFLADLVPTPSHLKPHYVMAYDVLPVVAMETKERLLRQAREEGWLLFFEHSPGVCAGYLDDEGVLDPVEMGAGGGNS